jgi:beta-alanine degradation protein BauB
MKTLLALSLALGLAGTARAAGSMDPLTVGGDIYKKVFENDAVRVMEVTFAPGAKIAMHSHPDHFAYVIKGGNLRITNAAGKGMDAALTPGQVLWINAESHAAENTGTAELKLLVTELKGHKTKKKAASK